MYNIFQIIISRMQGPCCGEFLLSSAGTHYYSILFSFQASGLGNSISLNAFLAKFQLPRLVRSPDIFMLVVGLVKMPFF
jgi:hypothetical protein